MVFTYQDDKKYRHDWHAPVFSIQTMQHGTVKPLLLNRDIILFTYKEM